MSAKAYKDKKAMPLVEKLKDKVTRQEQQISRLTDKVMPLQ